MPTALTDASVVAALADHLFDPSRDQPVLVVTVTTKTHAPLVDVAELQRAVGGAVWVELLPTVEAAWQLTRHLPAGYEVWGGAVRLWLPGATVHDDPLEHPLFLVRPDEDPAITPGLIARFLAERGFDRSLPAAAEQPTRHQHQHAELAIHPDLTDQVEVAEPATTTAAPTAPTPPAAAEVSTDHQQPADSARLEADLVAATRRAESAEELTTDLRRRVRALTAQLELARARTAALTAPVYADTGQQLRHDVRLHWLRVVDESLRNLRPLRNYHLGPVFTSSIANHAIDREQLLTSIVRVLTYDAYRPAHRDQPGPGRAAHQLHTGTGSSRRPVARPTGALAWSCLLQRAPVGLQLRWWECPNGSVELDRVVPSDAGHDGFEMPTSTTSTTPTASRTPTSTTTPPAPSRPVNYQRGLVAAGGSSSRLGASSAVVSDVGDSIASTQPEQPLRNTEEP